MPNQMSTTEKITVTLSIDRKLMEWIRARAREEQRTLSIVVDRALRAERARCEEDAARSDAESVDDPDLEVVRQE